jgi:hypothetical protein
MRKVCSIIFHFFFLFQVLTGFSQVSAPGIYITCYHEGYTYSLNPSAAREKLSNDASSRVKRAVFDATFVDLPAEARYSVDEALAVWASYVSSPITIHIQFQWTSLPENALASTGAGSLYRNFKGAKQNDIWYPVSLAEKLSGRELNKSSEPDIVVKVNRNLSWYYGTDGKVPVGRIDLMSVVLHEVAHGLGFISSATVNGELGQLQNQGFYLLYDLLLVHESNRLIDLSNSSSELKAALTSGALYLDTAYPDVQSNGDRAKVFAPSVFLPSLSISHLDENTYPIDNINALMTPYVAIGEAVHYPGPILIKVLEWMGWGEVQTSPAIFKPYPNPVDDWLNINIPASTTVTGVDLIDLSGRSVQIPSGVTMDHGVLRMDVSHIVEGLYVLILQTSTSTIHEKIFIRH